MLIKKKLGFTLVEVLIALVIIGFISAVLLPIANKLKPDTVKIKYLTTYDSITEVTSNLAKKQSIFLGYTQIDGQTYLHQKAPFLMKQEDYCENFADGINAINPPNVTVNNNVASIDFNTKNGIAWTINATSSINPVAGPGYFLSQIDIWLDGNRENNATNNHHWFYNTADGQTHIGDELGLKYKATRTNLKFSNLENILLEELTEEKLPNVDDIQIVDLD